MQAHRITQRDKLCTQASSPLSLSQILFAYKVKSTKNNYKKYQHKQMSGRRMQSSLCSRSSDRRPASRGNSEKNSINRNKSKSVNNKRKMKLNVLSCSQDQIKMKQQLESQYMQSIEYLYKTAVENEPESYCKLKTTLPEPAVYFLGSIIQKIKKLGIVSHIQFVEQCIKIFHKSSGPDIQQFVATIQSIMATDKQHHITTKRIANTRSSSDDRVGDNSKEGIKMGLRQMHDYKCNNDGSVVECRKEQNIKSRTCNIYLRQDEQTERTPKKLNEKQNIQSKGAHPIGTDHKIVNSLCNIPITSSVESNKILHTPTANNILTESSQLLGTPFDKIEQISRNVSKLVGLGLTVEEKGKQCIKNVSLPVIGDKQASSKRVDFHKIRDNEQMLRIVRSPKPSIYEHSKQRPSSIDHKQKEVDLTLLYSKYKYFPPSITMNKQCALNSLNSSCAAPQITKLPCHAAEDRGRSCSVRKDTNSRSKDDDRIERLTARVQNYIQTNAMKIESSKLARDLY